ncbi:hypothetical protein DVH05_008476 [Phytophthora capsici]|nr:hypothetical protein DVH05_008476 [Phytophthora capsici]
MTMFTPPTSSNNPLNMEKNGLPRSGMHDDRSKLAVCSPDAKPLEATTQKQRVEERAGDMKKQTTAAFDIRTTFQPSRTWYLVAWGLVKLLALLLKLHRH